MNLKGRQIAERWVDMDDAFSAGRGTLLASTCKILHGCAGSRRDVIFGWFCRYVSRRFSLHSSVLVDGGMVWIDVLLVLLCSLCVGFR